MRVLLRVLAPLLGVGLAAVGVLTVIEVVAAWVRPVSGRGLLVPWVSWRTTLEQLTWQDNPVRYGAIGVGVVGLLLLLLGLVARRHDVLLSAPSPEITVTTSPRVLARIVGRRVRSTDDVAAASVSASARKLAVRAEGWSSDAASNPDLSRAVRARVDELLDELPLARRPRVAVSVRGRKGP